MALDRILCSTLAKGHCFPGDADWVFAVLGTQEALDFTKGLAEMTATEEAARAEYDRRMKETRSSRPRWNRTSSTRQRSSPNSTSELDW